MDFKEYSEIYKELWQDRTKPDSLLQTEMRRLLLRIQTLEDELKEMKIKKNEYDEFNQATYYNHMAGELQDELKHYKIYFTALSEFAYGYPTTSEEYYDNMIQVVLGQKKYAPPLLIYLTNPLSSNITSDDLFELKEKLDEVADEEVTEILKRKENIHE